MPRPKHLLQGSTREGLLVQPPSPRVDGLLVERYGELKSIHVLFVGSALWSNTFGFAGLAFVPCKISRFSEQVSFQEKSLC